MRSRSRISPTWQIADGRKTTPTIGTSGADNRCTTTPVSVRPDDPGVEVMTWTEWPAATRRDPSASRCASIPPRRGGYQSDESYTHRWSFQHISARLERTDSLDQPSFHQRTQQVHRPLLGDADTIPNLARAETAPRPKQVQQLLLFRA